MDISVDGSRCSSFKIGVLRTIRGGGGLSFPSQYFTFGLMGLMGREFGYALCRFRRFQLFGCISWEGIWHLHYIGFRLFIILSRCHSFRMMTSGVPCLLPYVCLRLSLDYSWAHAKAKIDSK